MKTVEICWPCAAPSDAVRLAHPFWYVVPARSQLPGNAQGRLPSQNRANALVWTANVVRKPDTRRRAQLGNLVRATTIHDL